MQMPGGGERLEPAIMARCARHADRSYLGQEGAVNKFTHHGRRRKAALSLAFGLSLFSVGSVAGIEKAAAQSSAEAISLIVPSAFQLVPGVEAILPLQIKAAAALPRRAIVLVRGLPTSVTLSEGRLFESGVWGIPAADVAKVKMSADDAVPGRNEVNISLVAIDGTLLAEARSSLVIMAGASGAQAGRSEPSDRTLATAAPAQDIPAGLSPAATRRIPPEQSEQLFGFVKKGDDQMAVGNVSAARLLYRHAAESGLAAGALALAASFDEEELRKLRVRGGVQADPQQAQFWYEKARELGSTEARDRLQRFGSR
jgi:hypothetical protein